MSRRENDAVVSHAQRERAAGQQHRGRLLVLCLVMTCLVSLAAVLVTVLVHGPSGPAA